MIEKNYIERLIASEKAVALFFSTTNCSVCTFLNPKIKGLIETDFPTIKFHAINLTEQPEFSSVFSVFTAPTLLVFFEGKEYIRKSQNMGIQEVRESIERIYRLMED